MSTEKNHTHGKLFSDIHSSVEKEFFNDDIRVEDDEQTALAREKLNENENYENAVNLVSALSFQLRYRESLALAERQEKNFQGDYALTRRLGVLYMKTLQFEKAINKFEKCAKTTDDPLDIFYLLGVNFYYTADYEKAQKYFEKCALLSIDDGEMYVAVLFWTACCLLKQKKSDEKWKPFYARYDGKSGHHTGYDAFVKAYAGEITVTQAVKICEDDTDLNKTCLYYGLSVLSRDEKTSREFLQKTLDLKEWFGGFAYIAAFGDFQRGSERSGDFRN